MLIIGFGIDIMADGIEIIGFGMDIMAVWRCSIDD